MLKPERLKESYDLLRKHLVPLHDDGDSDSLDCRFCEIMQHIEDLKWRVDSWERVERIIKEHEVNNAMEELLP